MRKNGELSCNGHKWKLKSNAYAITWWHVTTARSNLILRVRTGDWMVQRISMIYDWLITSVFRLSLTLCGVRAIIWLWSSPKLLPYFASLGTSPEYGSCLPRGIVRDWSKKNEISVLGRLESFLGQRLQEFVVTPLCNGQDTDRKTADLKWKTTSIP